MKRLTHGECDYAIFAYDGHSSRFVHITLDGNKDDLAKFNKDFLFGILSRMAVEYKVEDNSYVTFTVESVLNEIHEHILMLLSIRGEQS